MKLLFKNRRLITMFFLAISYTGCTDDNTVLPKIIADFTYKLDASTVEFINTSENARTYVWDLGDGTSSTETNPVKTYPIGSYMVVLKSSNAAGASASFESTVIILDAEIPLITLIGDATISVTLGGAFTDPGATAADNVDGDLTADIIVGGDAVDTAVEGSYAITYDVMDAQGNSADQVTRTINVTAIQCTDETAQSLDAADFNLTFQTDPGASIGSFDAVLTTVNNPDADNAVNASCKVGKIERNGGAQFANNQIEFDAKLDFSANAGFKLKVWSPVAGTNVLLKLEDKANAGLFKEVSAITTTAGAWEELTFDFDSSETGKYDKIILFFELATNTTETYFIDDFMLYGTGTGGDTEPTVAAPVPSQDAANVKSIFSDTYTDIAGTNLDTNWQGDIVSETVTIGGSEAIKYSNAKFIGMQLAGDTDFSDMEFLHIDIWTPDATVLAITPISPPNEKLVGLAGLTQGSWNSFNIPVGDFTGVDLSKVLQFKMDAQGGVNPAVIYMDNLYFYKTNGGGGGTDGEFATNGDFETGDDTGWLLFQNGGTSALDNTINNGGSWSGKIETNGASNPAFKQERIAVGTVAAGDVVNISFDHIGTVLPEGGVFNVILFGETSDGASFTEVFSPAPTLTDSWSTFTGTFTIPAGTDVSGGISLLIESVCGGAAGCSVSANIDNVSVTLN